MSQAPTHGFGFPTSGPLTPTDAATQLDESFDAGLSCHSGASRPSYAVAGTIWLDTSVGSVHSYYQYDGSDDNLLFSVNTTTGSMTLPSGVTLPSPSLTGAVSLANLNGGPVGGRRNHLRNPEGIVNQRAASTISDDEYGHDCWYALTQSNDIDVSTVDVLADGVSRAIRLEQTNASAQRMGYAQPLVDLDTYQLRGKTVTFGGRLRYSNAAAVRFAVLEWTGTANDPTSDVVNDWTSSTYTAGNFFNSTTLTVTAVGSITPAANTWTDWSMTADIGASANNVIVLYWTEGTAAQNSTLDNRLYLVDGDATGETYPYASRSSAEEWDLCLEFVEFKDSDDDINMRAQNQASGGLYFESFDFEKRKLMTPTITIISEASSGATGALSVHVTRRQGFTVKHTATGTDTDGYIRFSWSAIAEI